MALRRGRDRSPSALGLEEPGEAEGFPRGLAACSSEWTAECSEAAPPTASATVMQANTSAAHPTRSVRRILSRCVPAFAPGCNHCTYFVFPRILCRCAFLFAFLFLALPLTPARLEAWRCGEGETTGVGTQSLAEAAGPVRPAQGFESSCSLAGASIPRLLV